MKLTNPTDDVYPKSRTVRALAAAKGRHEVAVGGLVAGGILTGLAFLLAGTVLRGVGPTRDMADALGRTLIPEIRPDMKPEAMERWLFVLLTLASPFCVLAGLWVARAMRGRLEKVLSRPRVAGGLALIAGGAGIYLLHGNTLFPFFVFPQSALVDQGIVFGGALLLFLVAWRKSPGFLGSRCDAGIGWRVCVTVIAFAVALLPRGLSTCSILTTMEISPFAWEVHFQAVAYSLTQIYAGKPLLTASPPLYGYYAAFLLPVFKVIGLSVFKFCVVMGVLQGVALAAILLVAVSSLRMPVVRVLCCAALLFFVGSTCLVGRRPFDPVFQYWPIRFFFPALSVPVYLWAARQAKASAWIALGIFSGMALIWNIESGIAAAGAALFTLGVEAIGARCAGSAGRERSPGLFLALLITVGAMVVTGAIFWLGLQVQAGWKAPLHQTSEYQRLFYESGLMMEPMPLAVHPWWLVIATYLLGLGFGLRGLLSGRRTRFARLALFLSILGTGLFTYYQGRSVDFNLMNASWPAILLGFLMVDRLLRAIRARALPRGMCWVALPAAYLGLMGVVMLPGAFARVWSFGAGQWRAVLTSPAAKKADLIDQRVAFIRDHVGIDQDCVILADYQAVYFMETGLRSSLDAPGLTEIFFLKDLETLREDLTRNPPRHLFVDEATMEELQLTETVKDNYRTVATFPDGKLVYLQPK